MTNFNIYTTFEVANILGFRVETIRRHIKEGRLKANKVGSEYRITGKQLQDYVEGKTE